MRPAISKGSKVLSFAVCFFFFSFLVIHIPKKSGYTVLQEMPSPTASLTVPPSTTFTQERTWEGYTAFQKGPLLC